MDNKVQGGEKKRLVIGISGASGAILGIGVLQALKDLPEWETHLVVTRSAELTIAEETGWTASEVMALADMAYDIGSFGANIASGTFRTEGMIVVPCSMKTVAGIACGYSDNLLLRAADVTIKERRKLVVVPRESPLSVIHLRNILTLAEAGAIVIPPVVAYYAKPFGLEDVNRHIIGKILDKFDIEVSGYARWDYGKNFPGRP